MIMQFVDLINRNDPPAGSTIRNFSNNRFFNDRIVRNTVLWPRFTRPHRTTVLYPEKYVLYFKLNAATSFDTFQIQLYVGTIDSYSKEFKIIGENRLAVDVPSNVGKPLKVAFTVTGPAWSTLFHSNLGNGNCPVVFDTVGLIQVSEPTDDMTMRLPRFVSGIRSGRVVLGGDLRGSVGQPYGRAINKLRTYTVEFMRVHADAIDEYFDRVNTTVPHWIVPYSSLILQAP